MLFPNQSKFVSLMVFKLNSEWYALRTEFLKEICTLKAIHKIPHRTNSILHGLVNLHGQLQLCISLQHALELNPTSLSEDLQSTYMHLKRLVVIEKNEDIWVFEVDEIDRIYIWDLSQFQSEENKIQNAKNVYFKELVIESDRRINLIDDELLFYRLQKTCKGST